MGILSILIMSFNNVLFEFIDWQVLCSIVVLFCLDTGKL